MCTRWLGILLTGILFAPPASAPAQEAAPDSLMIDEEASPATARADTSGVEEEEEEKKRDPKFDFRFDPGVEVLFTMVRLLKGDSAETVYEAEVDSVFAEYADHAGVDVVREFLDRGVRYEVMINTLLCHGSAPGFEKEFPYWTADSSLAGSAAEDRGRLLSAVRSFYRDARFQEFWDVRWEGPDSAEAHAPPEETDAPAEPDSLGTEASEGGIWVQGLEAVEDSLYEKIYLEIAHEPFRLYYGSRGDAVYRVIPTWQSPADTMLATRSDDREMLGWVVPLAPDSSTILDRARWESSMAVELGIAVVNPLADWLWPYLAEYGYLFEYLTRGRGGLGLWSSWGECFVDHLRRAVQARVLRATDGEAEAEAYLRGHEERGYGLIRILYDHLSLYERNRRHYLSLVDFCPDLISVLSDVKAEVASREAAFGALVGPADRGLAVTRVLPEMAAARAGVAVGDTVTAVDGEPVGPGTDLEALARARGVGGRLEVDMVRDGRPRRLVLLLGADLINYRFELDV